MKLPEDSRTENIGSDKRFIGGPKHPFHGDDDDETDCLFTVIMVC